VSYLLDTNLLSEVRRPRPDPGVAMWFAEVAPERMSVSVLVLGEIRRGVELLRGRDLARSLRLQEWLEELKETFADRVIDVSAPVAETWGRIDGQRRLPVVDGLLAATALVHGLVVVTRDTAPFEQAGVPFLDPWSSPR
jgi:hypothetical protein